MSFKIGFNAFTESENISRENITTKRAQVKPRKSVVQVNFPERHLTCAYYNDLFDLHIGDMVYVEGKLESVQGIVVEVSYTFKIKLSDYKKITHLVDTKVTGDLFFAGSHAVAYQNDVIPFEKVKSWYIAPYEEQEEIISSEDGEAILLDDLSTLKVDKAIGEKGFEYFAQNRVLYFEINDGRCRAIVNGNKYYTVEFDYANGVINNVVCDCYGTGICKHDVATILQLKDTLRLICEIYTEFDGEYLAAIYKGELFKYAIVENTPVKITIND